MTITITVANNMEYCREHGLIRTTEEECVCNQQTRAECHFCQGSGLWQEKIFPHELNLANANFATLWNALGLQSEPCGEIDARIVTAAIKTLDERLLLRATTYHTGLDEDDQPAGARMYSFGIDQNQASRYLRTLAAIAGEAEQREELIIWG